MAFSKLLTPTFRVSFPAVFEPRAAPGSTVLKYSIACLFNKKRITADPEQAKLWKALQDSVNDCARLQWPIKLPASLRLPFRSGAEKADKDGYDENIVFFNTSSKTRPGLVDANLQPIIDPNDFYAGCYARAMVNPFAYDTAGNMGVSFGLQNIQKVSEGEPFSGRSKPEDDFDAIASDETESMVTGLFD